MLYRKLIYVLLFVSSYSYSSDICLYDANINGVFSGADEVRECEKGYTSLGVEVETCPNGRAECSMIAGNPICPIDPSYTCSQTNVDSAFTCASLPPRAVTPSDLKIENDSNGNPILVNTIGREVCPGPTNTEVCPEPEPCKFECTLLQDGEPDCELVCPPEVPCEQPEPEPFSYSCPSNISNTCTLDQSDSEYKCNVGPTDIPDPCRLEFDQLDNPVIVCDERRATCQLEEGEFACPFNSSASACTRPDSNSPYTCHVEEQTCLATTGNTIVNPVDFPPFPTETKAETMPDGGTCEGEIRIFNGEPFSCNLAGVRSRWDNCCNNGNNIIDEALDNYFDGVVTMAEGVLDFSGAEFIIDIVSLYMAGLPAYHLTEALVQIGNYFLTPCADDSLTSSMIATGRCVTVGTRCVESLFGTCLQEKQIECCFASKLARIINQQARPQLSLDFGTPEDPDCRGLSPEEFQSIDFSQIDLSEYIDDIQVKSQETIDSEIGISVADDLIRIQGGG